MSVLAPAAVATILNIILNKFEYEIPVTSDTSVELLGLAICLSCL